MGMTTAHYLTISGHKVVVFDKEAGPALCTSKANGAQLSYSYTDAMATPPFLAKLPGILVKKDPAFRVTPALKLSFLKWGAQFLRNCTPAQIENNTVSLSNLALASAKLMDEFNTRLGKHYDYRKAGKLVLLSTYPDANSQAMVNRKTELGCEIKIVEKDEVYALEPSLKKWNLDIAAALYSATDEIGDPYLFAKTLQADLETKGVEFYWGEAVKKISRQGNHSLGLTIHADCEYFDAVVVCTADDSSGLLKQAGISVPVLPVTGYSVTLPATDSSPDISITVQDKKIVFCRLGQNMRIAGYADINIKTKNNGLRISSMIESAQKIAPQAANFSSKDINTWVGHRPVTPNNMPICRQSKLPGLYLNLGHGMFGWTLCAITGKKIADLIQQKKQLG